MILEAVVKAFQQSGQSRYRVAKETGIDQSVLFRIFHGGSCSIQTADVLCEYFGLKLVSKKDRKGR